MKDECSVLVLSCDKNEGLLNIFFDFYKRNWSDCPYKIYLGVENAKIQYDGVVTLNSSVRPWAGRVMDYLKQIDTDYVLIILDDFILEQPADTGRIDKFLSYMQENKNIATVSIADIYDKNNQKSDYEGLLRRTARANYLLNLQVGIWNKAVLLELMREDESPWQTELYGSIRARKLKDKEFLCLPTDENSPYKYGRGWLMVRGAWNGNEIIRLNLQNYTKDIFDGKDIIYSNFMPISLHKRIVRRMGILYRQLLSDINIYI